MQTKKYRLILLFLVLFTILFITSCNKDNTTPTQPITTGNIQGKVTNASDSSAINNASVETNPATSSVMSDQNGDFMINDVTSGTYSVTASKSGYIDSSVNVLVVAGKTSTANIQLTVSGTAPSAPTLSSPTNGTTNVALPPTLSWNASSGATSYRFQVSTSDQFTNTVYDQSNMTSTSKKVIVLSHFSKYFWRVNAKNSYGTSSWSSIRNFTTSTGGTGGTPCSGDTTVAYAGKIYNAVQIGTQCWLKENLDIGTMINGSQNQKENGTTEKYCYNNDPANCNTYGGLYQWEEAMKYITVGAPGEKGICPPSWHIPTYEEFETMKATVNNDGNSLKAVGQGTGAGAGTNTSGFSALLTGTRLVNGSFANLGNYASFWSSSGWIGYRDPIPMGLDYSGSGMSFGYASPSNGFSVRCLRD